MTHLNKINLASLLKCFSSNFNKSYTKPVFHRFYGTKISSLVENDQTDQKFGVKTTQGVRKKAQAALREYLHSTRGLEYMDADYISHNSPLFLDNLLKKVESDSKIEQSMSRLLRYHPINEYEPFFESMGLKPLEYAKLLPRHLMYLNDDAMLLENYQVLCNYGISRSEIGKIYTNANEVFKYGYGVLLSKLRGFEELGFDQKSVIKVVSSNPYILIGGTSIQFRKVLERLKGLGVDFVNIEENLINYEYYNWSRISEQLGFLSNVFDDEMLRALNCQISELLFGYSGSLTFLFVGFLVKMGYRRDEICSVLSQSPQGQVETFVTNLRNCYQFLVELDMEALEVGDIVRSHPLLLGSCSLKKVTSLLTSLRTGKYRLSILVKENPQILKDWVVGLRADPLPNLEEGKKSLMLKTKFLLDLGFVENSEEFNKVLKLLRGKGSELQERFDCFVNAGISEERVSEMVKLSPRVLNQSKAIIEMKINYFLNELGYPLSALVGFPVYVNYSMERIKLRFSMYNWLINQRRTRIGLTLSTILACSDKVFKKHFVDEHPGGPEVYQKLKEEINPD